MLDISATLYSGVLAGYAMSDWLGSDVYDQQSADQVEHG
jgi:hypothetical protein